MKLSSLSVITALLFALSGCAGGPKTESFGQAIDSAAVTTKVKTALLKAEDISGTNINVDTFKDQVMLSGFVNNAQEKQRALEVTGQIRGVGKVIDKLQVMGE